MDEADTKRIKAWGTTKQQGHSYLFLLRLWPESDYQESDTGEQHPQWHGKLQYVLDHNAQYFHDWPALVDLLLTMLPDLELREHIVQGETDPEGRE